MQTLRKLKNLFDFWRVFYKKQGWHKVCKFNSKGKIGNAYALHKHKNCKTVELQQQKLHKARPITPMKNHPMAQFLHYIGRAWMFIVNQWSGEHSILKSCQEFPKFVQDTVNAFGRSPDLEHFIFDIEGCYPAMPKEAILVAMLTILSDVRKQQHKARNRCQHINVPSRGKGPCEFGNSSDNFRKNISYTMMINALKFSLDNTFIFVNGKLLRQVEGIPNGCNVSKMDNFYSFG